MLASSLVNDELELSVHCVGVCLLTDVPGICAIVSSVCAASNRISDGDDRCVHDI